MGEVWFSRNRQTGQLKFITRKPDRPMTPAGWVRMQATYAPQDNVWVATEGQVTYVLSDEIVTTTTSLIWNDWPTKNTVRPTMPPTEPGGITLMELLEDD